MRVVMGGAYSGKRQFVRDRNPNAIWISSYNHHVVTAVEEQLHHSREKVLVLEGFEKWIETDLEILSNQEIREKYTKLFQKWKVSRKEKNNELYMIFLEMGRGIVPVDDKERRLRDAMGWVQQDAVKFCDEAYYIWHGIARQMIHRKEEGNHESTEPNSKTN